MKCKDPSVVQVLVGTSRVGIVGLRQALKEAEQAGLAGREEIVEFLLQGLEPDNYIPDPKNPLYRTALWREYLRHRGEDFSDFFSEVAVTVRADEGQGRDSFVKMLASVLAEFELEPVIDMEPAAAGSALQMVIRGEVIVEGYPRRQDLKTALHKSVSDW